MRDALDVAIAEVEASIDGWRGLRRIYHRRQSEGESPSLERIASYVMGGREATQLVLDRLRRQQARQLRGLATLRRDRAFAAAMGDDDDDQFLGLVEVDPTRSCRVCGCTDLKACAAGCSWVPDPLGLGALCSACRPAVAVEAAS